jgi:maltooligosyltrehalose trehalohydrolase
MLFQGQEFAARSKFNFFTDHHPELGKQVTAGRRREFRRFKEFAEHPERLPDPQSSATFEQSRLDLGDGDRSPWCLRLYRFLLRLRRGDPVLRWPDRAATRAWAEGDLIFVERSRGGARRLLVATLHGQAGAVLRAPGRVLFHSEQRRFGGDGRINLERPGAVLLG